MKGHSLVFTKCHKRTLFNCTRLLFCVSILLIVFLHVISGVSLAEDKIVEIDIIGNERVDDSSIILQISSKVGASYVVETVERDIKEIYKTGYFDQVIAKIERVPEKGGGKLVFQVVEKPSIREVNLEGNEAIDDEKLKEKLNIGGRRFLDRTKINAGIEAAKKYYTEEGYYGTEIRYTTKSADGNRVDITFTVDEGEKKVIRRVKFVGNKEIESSELEDQIQTTHYRWWSSWITGSGIVKKELLENDVRELTRYYLSKGYLNIKVSAPIVSDTEDGLSVEYRLEEGPVFNVGEITVVGDLLENNQEQTLKGIGLKTGDVFNVEQLRKDTFQVSEKFTDIGYAFANVEPLTNIKQADRIVDVRFSVDKGKLVNIGRINISGNRKTRDNVIRRSLQIQERQLFSSSKVKRSQELIQRLGFFDEVTLTPEPSVSEDEVDLSVAVREASTGSFSIGGGISSGEGFIIASRIAEANLFGSGNTVAFSVNTGNETENYVLSFDNPRINDSWWSGGMDLLSVKREFNDFDRKQAGGAVTVGHPLWFLDDDTRQDVRFLLKYEYLDIDISDVSEDAPQLVVDQEGRTTSSSITPQIIRNTINNPLDPETGSRQAAGIELAGIGAQEEFWLLQLSNTWYHPLYKTDFGSFVFSQRTNFGYGETYNNEDFPLFRRFFPGGINSVRGYDSREMGPKDEEGNEYGGSKQLVANFEIIYPLINAMGLKGVFFYDIGEAFDDYESIEIGELRAAIGWGIRWRSPIAPIRIEIGYPLDKEDGDKSVVTNFSFGAPL